MGQGEWFNSQVRKLGSGLTTERHGVMETEGTWQLGGQIWIHLSTITEKKCLQNSFMSKALKPVLGNQHTWVPFWNASTLIHTSWGTNRRSHYRAIISLWSWRHGELASYDEWCDGWMERQAVKAWESSWCESWRQPSLQWQCNDGIWDPKRRKECKCRQQRWILGEQTSTFSEIWPSRSLIKIDIKQYWTQ